MGLVSKQKGKSGEREAAKIFSNIFGGSWIRVPHSGAFVGGKNASRKLLLSDGQIKSAQADLIPPDELDIVIEVKNYLDFPFHRLMLNEPIPLLEDWLLEIHDCIDKDDFWLLVMKFNRKGWYVLFESKHLADFILPSYALYNSKLHKTFVFTGSLTTFLETNKQAIATLMAKKGLQTNG